MHQINPRKLMHSKWTAVTPKNKEKHFMVVKVLFDEEQKEVVSCLLEAVHSRRVTDIDWRQLKDSQQWRQGWK